MLLLDPLKHEGAWLMFPFSRDECTPVSYQILAKDGGRMDHLGTEAGVDWREAPGEQPNQIPHKTGRLYCL